MAQSEVAHDYPGYIAKLERRNRHLEAENKKLKKLVKNAQTHWREMTLLAGKLQAEIRDLKEQTDGEAE